MYESYKQIILMHFLHNNTLIFLNNFKVLKFESFKCEDHIYCVQHCATGKCIANYRFPQGAGGYIE